MLRTALAALIPLALTVLHAHAADIRTFKDADGRSSIVVMGELQRGDDEKFGTLAGTVTDDATVWFDSLGGSLLAGLHIGTAIRLKAWRTAVPDDATCVSACGLMWLGGVQRSVGRRARVGFHAAYVTADGRKQEVGSGNALVGSYLNRLGLADAAVVYLTAAPPDGAAWLTDAMARQLGIRAEFGSAQVLDRLALASPQAPASMPDATPAPVPAPAPGSRSPSPGDLMADLYRNFPWSVRIPKGETCVGRPCKVRMVAADAWTGNDGVERRLVVGAAEVKDDCHACSAIMGIGVFRLEGGSWRKESANPAVTRFGGWGVFQGKVTFLDGGALGRVVMTEESDVGQGVSMLHGGGLWPCRVG